MGRVVDKKDVKKVAGKKAAGKKQQQPKEVKSDAKRTARSKLQAK